MNRAQIMFFREKVDFSWKSHFFREIMHFLAKMQLFTPESPKKHPFRIGFIRPGAQVLEKSHFLKKSTILCENGALLAKNREIS